MRTMIVMSRYEHEPSDRGIPMTTIVRLVRSLFLSTAGRRPFQGGGRLPRREAAYCEQFCSRALN